MGSGVSKTVHIDQSEYHFGTFLYPLGVKQYSVLPSSYIRSRISFFRHGVGSIPASMYCVVLETATLSNINLWLGGEVMLELKSVKVIHLYTSLYLLSTTSVVFI